MNRLAPQTELERKLLEDGESRDRLRKKKREEQRKQFEQGGHVFHGELERLKALLAEGRIFCDMPALADRDSILIRDTHLENSLICQPQQRNIHGRIFGGFLMHRAFELAFSTAYAFAGQMPCFLEVDHVDFLRPVSAAPPPPPARDPRLHASSFSALSFPSFVSFIFTTSAPGFVEKRL